LDEVTFVDEWWRAVKKAVDTDPNLHIVLTGSNSHDLKKGLDLMPGRWSKGAGELHLLPMLFEEWQEIRVEANWPKLDLVTGLRGFMRVGGFPAAVAEAGPECITPENAKKTYHRWIMGDVIKLGRQELFMKEVLGQLVKTMGSSVSLQGFAQKTQLMSYHTVQDYLSVLENCFALRTLFAYDPDTDTFRFKKEKKFYFTDPLVYWVALDAVGGRQSENFEECLAEMIAAEWLFRKSKRLGYYSSQSGEVDFINGKDWAIEIKWAPIVQNLSKAYKNLKIHDKKIWHQGNFFE
jgi:predicted AAA+ superfamily ATPase